MRPGGAAPARGPGGLPAGRALLDGAMGTALAARGLPQGTLPEEWLATRPEEVRAVHAAHAAAGAEVVLTCTFNLAAPRLEERLGGRAPGRPRDAPAAPLDADSLARLAEAAVRLAREGAPAARVAGALGPTGLAGPGHPPAGAEVGARYAAAAAALAAAGADLLWLETQYEAAEAALALAAARATGLAVGLTCTFVDDGGRLRAPDGTAAEALLEAAEAGGAAAAGVNCVFPGPALDALAAWAGARLRIPFALKPSPGLPGDVLAPEAFARALAPALAHARLAGACCGAGAEHLAALAAVFRR